MFNTHNIDKLEIWHDEEKEKQKKSVSKIVQS